VLDLEVYLAVKDPKKARELILEGDEIRQGGGRDEAYLAAIAKVAPAYDRFKKNPEARLDYRSWSVVVANHWGYLSQGNRANFSLRRRNDLSL
jgi:protein subunit release factor A